MSKTQHNEQIKGLLEGLRNAVIFERDERTRAPYEAKQLSESRIANAHRLLITHVRTAYEAGATKTMIAEELGIKNLARVGQLIKEAETNDSPQPERVITTDGIHQ